MSLCRFVARTALAAPFITGGLNSFQNADKLVGLVDGLKAVLPDAVRGPAESADSQLLIKANGAVMMAAGTALALGIAPRLSASVLGLQLIPTTAAGHRFWEKEGSAYYQSRTAFVSNIGLFGGLAAVALGGRSK